MSNETVIAVKNLSKSYRMYNSPAERLKELIHPFKKKYHKEFWALKDVSFEVKKGESIGIIGRNGSGKSTLLQLLCGVLQPTSGTVTVNGRVSALLELGAGFSPEFTGRDNVYMNGALMGINREEMDSRFAEIAAFADIGEFIEQPVKTYSSGMYVRLAFACAVNVEPEILIVDEALSVGDVRFQKKCYDKINALKKAGATIILVTHGGIKGLVTKGVVLERGERLFAGDAAEAELRYMQLLYPEEAKTSAKGSSPAIEKRSVALEREPGADPVANRYYLEVIPSKEDEAKSFGAGGAWVNWIRIYGLERPNIFHGGERLEVQISFAWDNTHVESVRQKDGLIDNLIVGCGFESHKGVTIFGFNSFDAGHAIDAAGKNGGCLLFKITLPVMEAGAYFIGPAIALGVLDRHVQLRWYSNLIQLQCVPNKKNVYGVMAADYSVMDSAFDGN